MEKWEKVGEIPKVGKSREAGHPAMGVEVFLQKVRHQPHKHNKHKATPLSAVWPRNQSFSSAIKMSKMA